VYSEYCSGIYDLKYCSIYARNTTDNTAPEARLPPLSSVPKGEPLRSSALPARSRGATMSCELMGE
jgi:hypothetical protein